MKKEIVINDIHFNTQKDAIETTRKILLELESEREIRPAIEGWDYLYEKRNSYQRYSL